MVELKAYAEMFKIHRPIGEFVDAIQALEVENQQIKKGK